MAIPVWDNPQISGGAKASILLVYREAKGYDASGAISLPLAISSSNYFAKAGNTGNFSMSRASCWITTVAFRFDAIFLMRSIEATVCARS
jgi:hypothetical protein